MMKIHYLIAFFMIIMATAITATPAVYTDTFTRADSATVGTSSDGSMLWNELNITWAISSNTLVKGTPGGSGTAAKIMSITINDTFALNNGTEDFNISIDLDNIITVCGASGSTVKMGNFSIVIANANLSAARWETDATHLDTSYVESMFGGLDASEKSYFHVETWNNSANTGSKIYDSGDIFDFLSYPNEHLYSTIWLNKTHVRVLGSTSNAGTGFSLDTTPMMHGIDFSSNTIFIFLRSKEFATNICLGAVVTVYATDDITITDFSKQTGGGGVTPCALGTANGNWTINSLENCTFNNQILNYSYIFFKDSGVINFNNCTIRANYFTRQFLETGNYTFINLLNNSILKMEVGACFRPGAQ